MKETNSKNSHFLAYLIPPITSIIYYITENKNNHVKFHTYQSITFGTIFLTLFLYSNTIALIFSILIKPFLALVSFYFWFKLVWASHHNKDYELPFIAKLIKNHLNKKI